MHAHIGPLKNMMVRAAIYILCAVAIAIPGEAGHVQTETEQRLYAAQKELAAEKLFHKILLCESAYQSDAVGDNGRAYGIAQFHRSTFNHLKQQAKMPDLQYKNAADQVRLLRWAIANGHENLWTCAKKDLQKIESVVYYRQQNRR